MITGFNPADMYARRPYPPRARNLPRRVQRHRRILDPQGVRLGRDRRRDREPDQSGARPDPRFRRRGRAGRDPPLRHRRAVRRATRRCRSTSPRCATCCCAIRARRSSGRIPASAGSIQPIAIQASAPALRPSARSTISSSSRRSSPIRASATSISTSRGTRSSNMRPPRPRSIDAGRRRCSTAIPDRFLFGTDNVAPADQAANLSASSTAGTRSSAASGPETQAAITMGNYERLFDAGRRRVRAWERRACAGAQLMVR